jgi:hypothetical protein
MIAQGGFNTSTFPQNEGRTNRHKEEASRCKESICQESSQKDEEGSG